MRDEAAGTSALITSRGSGLPGQTWASISPNEADCARKSQRWRL